jgi:DNA-directed RNA polymerase
MNEIIRDTFIALHDSDVLNKLDQEVRIRYLLKTVDLCSQQVIFQQFVVPFAL